LYEAVTMTEPESTDTEDTFDAITERLLGEPDVDEGRIFNSAGLRTNGKIFVMLSRGRITLKLPASRCAELVATGVARPFESGGRQMREWVSLVDASPAQAFALADEALAFLRDAHGGPASRPAT
jgi:hypothetical protein